MASWQIGRQFQEGQRGASLAMSDFEEFPSIQIGLVVPRNIIFAKCPRDTMHKLYIVVIPPIEFQIHTVPSAPSIFSVAIFAFDLPSHTLPTFELLALSSATAILRIPISFNTALQLLAFIMSEEIAALKQLQSQLNNAFETVYAAGDVKSLAKAKEDLAVLSQATAGAALGPVLLIIAMTGLVCQPIPQAHSCW